MPGRDGTGPLGLGPMTGGGRGWCNPNFRFFNQPFFGGYPYNLTFSGGYSPYPPYSPYTAYPYAYPYSYFGWGRDRVKGW